MARNFIIGDVHGEYNALCRLLKKINLQPEDKLIFTGDLIARGKQSLEVLTLLYSMGKQVVNILGNHDLHALFLYYSKQKPSKNSHLKELFEHKTAPKLFAWLLKCKLLYCDDKLKYIVTHAGIHPDWNVPQAIEYAGEINQFLTPENCKKLSNAYGNEPSIWNKNLNGWDKYRYIVNAFTRMRFIRNSDKGLDLTNSMHPNIADKNLMPWFIARQQNNPDENTKYAQYKFLFGHWASLNGESNSQQYLALDTGCVWGNKLTACCISDADMSISYFDVQNIK